jgi:galactose mutarotase-like enzyme
MPDSSALISIASGGLSAEVDPLGAQLSALRDVEGRDLLWDGDPAIWNGRAPVLFPIVGSLANSLYRVNGATFELPRHGFARHSLFDVVETTASSARFLLAADERTLTVYPFRFELEISFALAGATLMIGGSVRNVGDRPLPASLGFHPAFRWPLPYGRVRADHALQFERDEPAPVRRLNAQGLVEAANHPTPVTGRELVLRDALFEADAVIFDSLASGSVSYGAPEGPHLRIDFPDTPYLGVWTKPGAPFICVEPWHGIADPEGFQGDFRDKPGVFEVAPGEAREVTFSVSLRP